MMEAQRIKILLLTGVLFLVWFSGCTWNPFGKDEISGGHRQISGTVQLHDGSSPEGAYVWFEGFNIGEYTDGTGRFKLVLPAESSHGASGGVSGIYSIYFYLANYQLDSALVVVQEGEFVYSRGDINKEGKLYVPKVMRRFLRIHTSVNPSSVSANYTGNIEVEVTLTATIDSASVVVPRSIGGLLGAVLLKKSDSYDVFIHTSVSHTESREVIIAGKTPRTIGMTFNLINKPLAQGPYEVIPYLLMAHEAIPKDLMESLGHDVKELGPDYLNIPFRREGGQFEVR